jgi:hypothetical protein
MWQSEIIAVVKITKGGMHCKYIFLTFWFPGGTRIPIFSWNKNLEKRIEATDV